MQRPFDSTGIAHSPAGSVKHSLGAAPSSLHFTRPRNYSCEFQIHQSRTSVSFVLPKTNKIMHAHCSQYSSQRIAAPWCSPEPPPASLLCVQEHSEAVCHQGPPPPLPPFRAGWLPRHSSQASWQHCTVAWLLGCCSLCRLAPQHAVRLPDSIQGRAMPAAAITRQ